MTEFAAKARILRNSGYSYRLDRELYVNWNFENRVQREVLEDHSTDEIAKLVGGAKGPQWRFFFNIQPSPTATQELGYLLELPSRVMQDRTVGGACKLNVYF